MAEREYKLLLYESNLSGVDFGNYVMELNGARQKSLEVTLNRPGSLSFSVGLDSKEAKEILGYAVSRAVVVQVNDMDAQTGQETKRYVWSGPIWTVQSQTSDNTCVVSCVGWMQLMSGREFSRQYSFTDYPFTIVSKIFSTERVKTYGDSFDIFNGAGEFESKESITYGASDSDFERGVVGASVYPVPYYGMNISGNSGLIFDKWPASTPYFSTFIAVKNYSGRSVTAPSYQNKNTFTYAEVSKDVNGNYIWDYKVSFWIKGQIIPNASGYNVTLVGNVLRPQETVAGQLGSYSVRCDVTAQFKAIHGDWTKVSYDVSIPSQVRSSNPLHWAWWFWFDNNFQPGTGAQGYIDKLTIVPKEPGYYEEALYNQTYGLPFSTDQILGTYDTGFAGPVPRSRTYPVGQKIDAAIQELSDVESGFDYEIQTYVRAHDQYGRPILSRRFLLYWSLLKGTIYGIGADRPASIFSFNWGGDNLSAVTQSVDSSRLANRIIVRNASRAYVAQDSVSISKYGVIEDTIAISDTSSSDNVLKAYAGAELAYRSQPFTTYDIQPGFASEGSEMRLFVDYGLGDICYLVCDYPNLQIGRTGTPQSVRVFGYTVSVGDNGQEQVTAVRTTYSQ